MILDLTALQGAVAALKKSLHYLHSELARDPALYEQFRAACVQAFEFTYEVSYKMLKRQLELISQNPAEVDQMTYMQVIRSAAEAGLIADVARFRDYRDKRNITSHTYNAKKAEEVIAVLKDFVPDVVLLLAELEKRNRAGA